MGSGLPDMQLSYQHKHISYQLDLPLLLEAGELHWGKGTLHQSRTVILLPTELL